MKELGAKRHRRRSRPSVGLYCAVPVRRQRQRAAVGGQKSPPRHIARQRFPRKTRLRHHPKLVSALLRRGAAAVGLCDCPRNRRSLHVVRFHHIASAHRRYLQRSSRCGSLLQKSARLASSGANAQRNSRRNRKDCDIICAFLLSLRGLTAFFCGIDACRARFLYLNLPVNSRNQTGTVFGIRTKPDNIRNLVHVCAFYQT